MVFPVPLARELTITSEPLQSTAPVIYRYIQVAISLWIGERTRYIYTHVIRIRIVVCADTNR